jgi:hypothetical protein
MNIARVTFEIPSDRELLAAIGELSIRHEKLNYTLRLTIKSLGSEGLEIVMRKTKYWGSTKLRNEIHERAKKILKKKELEAILKLIKTCESVTIKRNDLIHSLFTKKKTDEKLRIRNSTGRSSPAPNAKEVLMLSQKIESVADSLNSFRLSLTSK